MDTRAQHTAQMILRRFWLRQVERVAQRCLDTGQAITLIPPIDLDYDDAAEIIEAASAAWSAPTDPDLGVVVNPDKGDD